MSAATEPFTASAPAPLSTRSAAAAGTPAGDALVPAHVLNVSWAADHRVVDGATLARFSGAWKGFVERPVTMLGEMR